MPVPCARCNMPLVKWRLAGEPGYTTSGCTVTCTLCGAFNRARVFPAVLAANVPARPEAALEGEAACYDHPAKRAVAGCSQCGRFVCQLCSVELGAQVWCPSCVAAGAGKAKAANLEAGCTLHDSMALLMPIVPAVSVVLMAFTIVAAPVSLVYSIAKWRQPLSLVRHSRWRFVAAILISLAEIGAWCWLLVFWATQRNQRPG